jgi:hypothetical protein
VGKTTHIRQKLRNDVYRVNNYSNQFDEYRRQKNIIIDEFRSKIDFSEMLNILDVHPTTLGARYRNKFLAAEEIWVVSNRTLDQQYCDTRNEITVEDRAAFVARFHNVYEMTKRGQLELVATPAKEQLDQFSTNNSDDITNANTPN